MFKFQKLNKKVVFVPNICFEMEKHFFPRTQNTLNLNADKLQKQKATLGPTLHSSYSGYRPTKSALLKIEKNVV